MKYVIFRQPQVKEPIRKTLRSLCLCYNLLYLLVGNVTTLFGAAEKNK